MGETSAGLCGEPIAITKGTFELDAVLGLRVCEVGGACTTMVLEPAEPSRERRVRGAGIAELVVELLERTCSFVFDKNGMLVADELESLRAWGCFAGFAPSGEFRMASAMTSIRGGVRKSEVVSRSVLTGDSKRPKRGRGGRSGIDCPLPLPGSEPERPRVPTDLLSFPSVMLFCLAAGDTSGVLGCV